MPSATQTAKDAVKQTAQGQKDKAAQNLDEMADALRGASGKMNEGDQPMLGDFAERAAGGLQQISTRLRSKDVDGLMRDAQAFAREQPLAFFGLSIAAGFLAMRFLKSSQSAKPSAQPYAAPLF